MSKQVFTRGLTEIWAKHERILGCRIPHDAKGHILTQFTIAPDDPVTIEDLDCYLTTNIPVFRSLLDGQGVKPPGGARAACDKPKMIRKRPLERRLYLVDLIVRLNPISRGRYRVDWKRTVAEWNRAHPLDAMTLPVLKAEYHHAVKNWPSATMQKLVASHVIAIGKLMEFPFDSLDRDMLSECLPRLIGITRQLSDECDAMINYYTQTDLPGGFLLLSINKLISMWKQYLETLDRYVDKEADGERIREAEK